MTYTGLMVFLDLPNDHMGLHNSHVAQVRSSTPLRQTCVVLSRGTTNRQKRL
jgi:hypothetical protein